MFLATTHTSNVNSKTTKNWSPAVRSDNIRESVHAWIAAGMTSRRAPDCPTPGYLLDMIPAGELSIVQVKSIFLLSAFAVEVQSTMLTVSLSDVAAFCRTTNTRARAALRDLADLDFDLVNTSSTRSRARHPQTATGVKFISVVAERRGEMDVIIAPFMSVPSVINSSHDSSRYYYSMLDLGLISKSKTTAEVVLRHTVSTMLHRVSIEHRSKTIISAARTFGDKRAGAFSLPNMRARCGTRASVRDSAFVSQIAAVATSARRFGTVVHQVMDIKISRTKEQKSKRLINVAFRMIQTAVIVDSLKIRTADTGITGIKRGAFIIEASYFQTVFMKFERRMLSVQSAHDVRRQFMMFCAIHNIEIVDDAVRDGFEMAYCRDELSHKSRAFMNGINKTTLEDFFVLLDSDTDEAISKRLHKSDVVRKEIGMDISVTGGSLSHVITLEMILETKSKKGRTSLKARQSAAVEYDDTYKADDHKVDEHEADEHKVDEHETDDYEADDYDIDDESDGMIVENSCGDYVDPDQD
jgi:hypothetical protein